MRSRSSNAILHPIHSKLFFLQFSLLELFFFFCFSRLLLGVLLCFFLLLFVCLLYPVSLSSLTISFTFGCYWPVDSICLSVSPSVRAKRYFISSLSNTVIDQTRRREGLKWERLQREFLKRFVLA
jgi:hypothetical protein